MEAPDKIYCERCSDGMYSHIDRWENADNIEYIRKDTMMEWFKTVEEYYSHPDTDNVVDMIRSEGKKWALQDVINKIESL